MTNLLLFAIFIVLVLIYSKLKQANKPASTDFFQPKDK